MKEFPGAKQLNSAIKSSEKKNDEIVPGTA
jgi:hypothetical protein